MKLTRLLLLIAVSAAPLPAPAQDSQPRERRAERTAPQIAPPPAGMGQVVFYPARGWAR